MFEARWDYIEKSSGVYDATALATLDSIITFQRQNGATVYYGLYATPTFYAQTTPAPTYADNITRGPWGGLGECSYPTSLPALVNFVTMIVNRYNKPGGAWYDAHYATLGKGIQYWETWNEPAMRITPANLNTGGSGSPGDGFWWGSKEQLVDFCQKQYATIKSLDSSIVVSTPGLTGGTVQNGDYFMKATGPVTGKTGLQSCDVLAFHSYTANYGYVTYGAWIDNGITGTYGLYAVRAWMDANGYNLPLWCSEGGMDGSDNATVRAWYADTPAVRYTMMARLLMSLAALGVKRFDPWHWEETSTVTGNSGSWQTDFQGVTKAYNDFASKALGKTITKATYSQYGTVSLTFSDGSSWIV